MNATQKTTSMEVIQSIADAIKGLGEIPSGHLYARLMDRMSLDQYNQIIDMIKSTGLVVEDPSHLLRWVG